MFSLKKLWRSPQPGCNDAVETQNTKNQKIPLITQKIKLNRNTMNTTTLGLRSLAAGLVLAGTISVPQLSAVDAFSDPVGYHTLSIVGASDNVMSLPMVRDAVFTGTVGGAITATSFNVLAGQTPPTWTADQFVYSAGIQRLTYYVEFTTGQLRGLFYKVQNNGTGSLTLDTEGDNLTTHPVNGVAAALAVGDSIKIRPYWTVKDAFEVNGTPIIESRANVILAKDDILIPNYTLFGTNKAAAPIIFHTTQVGGSAAGPGWRAVGQGVTDFADFVLRPNEAFITRRRNAATVSLTNLGAVNLNRAITFVPGGNGTSANDIYVSLARPSAVTLDASGLRIADQTASLIKDSANTTIRQDEVYAFNAPAGLNAAAPNVYFYLNGAAGTGWRKVGSAATDIGSTVTLEPGKAYIVRKKAANAGRDWVNDPNY
jgi:uncharacterized protein (TIGR02597 family)